MFSDIEVTATNVELLPGDIIILYTDGVSEAVNGTFDEFGLPRLKTIVRDLLTADPQASAEVIRAGIAGGVIEFTDDTIQYDDMTLLIVKRKEVVHDIQ